MNHDEFDRLAEAAMESGDPRERERMEGLVSTDPELREIWTDLKATQGALAGAGLEPLPAGLHDTVLRALAHETSARRERESWLDTLVAALRSRPGLALGGAVAAGLAIGVIGFGALSGGFVASRALAPSTSATMSTLSDATPDAVLAVDGARVELSVRTAGDLRDVRVSARATIPARVTFAWAPGTVRFAGVAWSSGEVPGITSAPGSMTLSLAGDLRSSLSFSPPQSGDAVLRVTLGTASGLKEETLHLLR
jgi:hypothetical protein